MDYQTARKRVALKRLSGMAVVLISAAFSLAGIFLFLYTSIDSAGNLLSGLNFSVKRMVYFVFDNTRMLLPIWNNAPVPDPGNIFSRGTLGFLFWYLCVFVGASLIGSANKLSRRLNAIDRQIEDESIRESLAGGRKRSRTELEEQVIVPNQPLWQQVHTLYIAPLVVGIILWVIAKVMG